MPCEARAGAAAAVVVVAAVVVIVGVGLAWFDFVCSCVSFPF